MNFETKRNKIMNIAIIIIKIMSIETKVTRL